MDPKTLGFDSWLDVYAYLKNIGFENEARVGFIIPPVIRSVVENQNAPTVRAEPSEVVMDMVTIRALAFDELYQLLPMEASRSVAIEMAEDMEHPSQPLIEFLHKIPTRTK